MRTYKEAFGLITEAYISEEIRPFHPRFCFCGTLAGSEEWYGHYCLVHNNYGDYTGAHYVRMEKALIYTIKKYFEDRGIPVICSHMEEPLWEEALFAGMCEALNELKKIHIERGENVDEMVFERRIKPVAVAIIQ